MESEPNLIEVLSNPLVLGVIIVYFMPTFFAIHNRSAAWFTCFGVNLLLGWTFLGWIVALILASCPSKAQIAHRDRVKRARDDFYLREASKSETN